MSFAKTYDPFFLSLQNNAQDKSLAHPELQQTILSRIRAAELVILEDAI